jgi:hypothetical protein
MAAIENIIAWAKQEQARLARQLQELLSGRLRTYEKHAQPPGWLEIDTTDQSIELCRLYISELSAIVARYPAIVPSQPAAPPPVPRFIPPVSASEPSPAPAPTGSPGFLHGLLHHGTAQHADWVQGWGVVKGAPPRWEFSGIYESHAEAEEAAAKAGPGYYTRWGSYNFGSQEFTSGPSFGLD